MQTEPIAFLRLARKFFESNLWQERREFSAAEAWLDMLATANYAPEAICCERKVLNLQRGEMLSSVRDLAVKWRWSKSKVARFLERLRREDRITFWDNNGTETRRIRFCNWELYNPMWDSGGTPVGHPRDTSNIREDTHTAHAKASGASIPSAAEVVEFGSLGAGIPADYCRQFHARATEEHGWVKNGELIDWQRRIVRYWAADRHTWIGKNASNQPNSKPATDRNAGTANAGKSGQYRGVGKVG